MKTDRELIELAAKAAGIKNGRWLGDGTYWVGGYAGGGAWNPLTDDGDALRLAIRLCMVVRTFRYSSDAQPLGFGASVTEQNGDDPYAATRRAIVKAAADIGEQK